MRRQVLERCQSAFPSWRSLSVPDVEFAEPKGFSSFTMAVRPKRDVEPRAVLYRHLEGKQNAILDFEAEKEVFLTLGAHRIAAHCHHYGATYRLEAFYEGGTLSADDLRDPDNLRGIADALHRLHQLEPEHLPERGFFELLHDKWGALARQVLVDRRGVFPENEQRLCEALTEIFSDRTIEKVRSSLPDGPLTFCHNDTYHGNIMKLSSGEIRLLDFEFSCLNHRAFDFANLFAETVMQHGRPDYPYFSIAEPSYTSDDISRLIGFYLDNERFDDPDERAAQLASLLRDTKQMLMMSDYMYAMAALPLAVEPIQKIRFIPYAHARFERFKRASPPRS